MGFTGFYWVLLGFNRFYWVLRGFTEFYWVLLGFIGFYRVLPGFTGFYRVLPGFTGFCRVLPSCTESHWVCSDRYRIKRFGWSRLWTIWRSWRDEWRRRNRQSANCAPLIDALMDGRGGRPIRGRDRGLAWRHGAADGAGDASELRFFFLRQRIAK